MRNKLALWGTAIVLTLGCQAMTSAPPTKPDMAAEQPCVAPFEQALAGTHACQQPAPAVSLFKCDPSVVAVRYETRDRYRSTDNGATFVCDQGAHCPDETSPVASFCR